MAYNKENQVTSEELATSLRTQIDKSTSDIVEINKKISSQASETNKLLSTSEIDDKINSVSAYPIYKDDAQNIFDTRAQLMAATVFYGADGKVRVPTTNDYTFVKRDETHTNHLCRYIYSINTWAFQIEINFNILEGGTGINITNEVINHNNSVAAVTADTLMRFAYDTEGHITSSAEIFFDDIPTTDSNNFVTSGVVRLGLNEKQDVLTAGQDIDITNNVISCTKPYLVMDVHVNDESVMQNKIAKISTADALGLEINSDGLLCVVLEE